MEYRPKNFYAGTFPIVTETGTAGGNISEMDIVAAKGGKIYSVHDESVTGLTANMIVGIAAHSALVDIPINYHATGEFQKASINMPDTMTEADVLAALNAKNIYLK